MAIMIPDKPYSFENASYEDIMFDSLKNLPEDWYVFHSFKLINVSTPSSVATNKVLYENETDFVLFNPKYGILCIEAKAGEISRKDGIWYYKNGKPINGTEGPYRQAQNEAKNLLREIERVCGRQIVNRCKILYAVWFPSITKEQLKRHLAGSDTDINITLTNESLFKANTLKDIEKIFEIEMGSVETDLGKFEVDTILKKVFCPAYNLKPSKKSLRAINIGIFDNLLKEQSAILNYIEDQKTAVISGAAGTGKTLVALEKAKRHAQKGEKVLFLCYNRLLAKELTEHHPIENVDFSTIANFNCKYCGDLEFTDYKLLKEKLEEDYYEGTFPYKHVIIDEGQDFGQEDIEDTEIISLMSQNVLDNKDNDGSFYIFYDKNQFVQGKTIPEYIQEADCKLTLYKNCRNTTNIAKTSISLFNDKEKIKLATGGLEKDPTRIFISDNEEERKKFIDDTIKKCLDETGEEFDDVVILTCSTEEKSFFTKYTKDNIYSFNGKEIPFTTARKFKGLEADSVILIDISKETFEDERKGLVFYVGASRARFNLYTVCSLSKEECGKILEDREIKAKDLNDGIASIFSSSLAKNC